MQHDCAGISKEITGAHVRIAARDQGSYVDYVDNASQPPLPAPFQGMFPGGRVVYDTPKLHYLYKITFNHNAGVFALDLADAEFGHFEPVLPWDDYIARTVKEVLAYHEPNELPGAPKGSIVAITVKRFLAANAFYDALKVALAKQRSLISLEGLLMLSDVEFEMKQSRIVGDMTTGWTS